MSVLHTLLVLITGCRRRRYPVLVFVYGGPHAQLVNYACRLHSQRSAAQRPNLATASTLSATAASAASTACCRCCDRSQRCNMVPCDAKRCSLAAVGVTLTSSCSSCCRRALSPPGASSPRRYCQYAHVPSAGRIPGLHRRRTWVCMRHVHVALPAHRRVTTELGPLPAHGCMY